MKDDVVSLAGKKRTQRKKRRPAVGRLLPQWPDYLDYEDWVNANTSLAFARTQWGHYENVLGAFYKALKKKAGCGRQIVGLF